MATLVEFVLAAEEFPLGELFDSLPTVSIELERIVPTSDSLFPYIWIRGTSRDEVETVLENARATAAVSLVDDLGDRGLLYRTAWNPDVDGLVEVIAESNATLLSAVGKRGQWTFQLRVVDHAELGVFQDRCQERGIRISVSRIQPLEYTTEDGELTPAQLEALELAFQRGYFDDPRRVTLDELSNELRITRQSLAGRLRRGHRNLLGGLFGSGAGSKAIERASSFDD
ncbi:helix-turn-helix domain-containing protein [Natrialbaceae archaeon A-arb3/5]